MFTLQPHLRQKLGQQGGPHFPIGEALFTSAHSKSVSEQLPVREKLGSLRTQTGESLSQQKGVSKKNFLTFSRKLKTPEESKTPRFPGDRRRSFTKEILLRQIWNKDTCVLNLGGAIQRGGLQIWGKRIFHIHKQRDGFQNIFKSRNTKSYFGEPV